MPNQSWVDACPLSDRLHPIASNVTRWRSWDLRWSAPSGSLRWLAASSATRWWSQDLRLPQGRPGLRSNRDFITRWDHLRLRNNFRRCVNNWINNEGLCVGWASLGNSLWPSARIPNTDNRVHLDFISVAQAFVDAPLTRLSHIH
jgi:hypothetical protein